MKSKVKQTTILITFISSLQYVLGASQSVSACFKSNQKSLQIQCPAGNMVRIIRSFYGYAESVAGQDDRCHFEQGDTCVYEEHDSYPCVGRQSCYINLPTGGYGRRIPDCNKESNYFQIDYECVPVTNNYGICNQPELTSEWGYISTPNYPNNYNASKKCDIKIKVKPEQKINLYIIDMDLESNGSNGCPDWFYAHDNLRSVTLCGKRSTEPLFTSSLNEMHIQFVSNSIVNHKGFWLYYEASPPATTTTESTTTSKTVMRTEWQPPQTHPAPFTKQEQPATNVPVTKITKHINISEKEHIPFAAIVGGVIGTLSIILIILLVLLAVKWWKERRRKQDKSRFIEVQNPGYRNSNEFRNSGTDMCYNYIDC